MNQANEDNPARKYEWFGDENKLRKRYGELLGKAFRKENITKEEAEEFELVAELLSSDH